MGYFREGRTPPAALWRLGTGDGVWRETGGRGAPIDCLRLAKAEKGDFRILDTRTPHIAL